jgi:hypothetical protein
VATSRQEYFEVLGELLCSQGCADLCGGYYIEGSLSSHQVEELFENSLDAFRAGEVAVAGLTSEADLAEALFREPVGEVRNGTGWAGGVIDAG